VIRELVQASAGVPRDFLRIFVRSFNKAQTSLPINLKHVRVATHEFFQEEKKSLIEERATTHLLFEGIFEKICQPSNTYIFFVDSLTYRILSKRDSPALFSHLMIVFNASLTKRLL
jgi:hypothetical protein